MSRSLPDLIDIFEADAEQPIEQLSTRAIWDAAMHRYHRRRAQHRLLASVATAIVVLTLTVIPLLGRGLPGRHPVDPATPGPTATTTPTPNPVRSALTTTLRPSTAGVWTIAPLSTNQWLQLARVYRSDQAKQGGGMVELYEPGSFDPASMRAGVPTTVGGRPAYFRVVEDPFSGDESGEHRSLAPALAWQYADGSWAVVRGWFQQSTQVMAPTDGSVPDVLRQIAQAVVIGEPTPARLPFKVGYRPDGLTPVIVRLSEPTNPGGELAFDRIGAEHDWRDPYQHLWLALRISMRPALPQFWRPDTTVSGLPAMRNGTNEVIIQRDGYWLAIGSGERTTAIPTNEIERIFEGLTIANFADPNSWFDATSSEQ